MMKQLDLGLGPERRIYSVGEVTTDIRELLEAGFSDVWIMGEISNARAAPSGHHYFTLKDGDAQLKAVCFRQNALYLKVKPRNGLEVLARGRISVYEARGEYQLYVEHIEPQGYGALQLAFEQLKKKLSAEGLFDDERKRTLPTLPRRIGIVTSPSGAAIADMLRILERRFDGLHVQLFPAQVQGEGAGETDCGRLALFQRHPIRRCGDCGAWRRIAGGLVGVQRRGRCARHRGERGPGDRGGGTPDGFHDRGLCGGCSGADALGGGGVGYSSEAGVS